MKPLVRRMFAFWNPTCTGRPPTGVASVTVVHRTLTWADIDATAAYALGPGAAEWLRHRVGRTGLVVGADGSTTLVRAS